MARELRFDVSALDQASQVFARMAVAVERFEKRLDKLDGKTVDVEVDVDTDRADAKIGRFATETRDKLRAALSNLPEVEIDADSSDAEKALADVRRRMQELSDKTIDVDISADDAIAEARALKRELDTLARTSPDIRVRVDAAAARAPLAELNAMFDSVKQKSEKAEREIGRFATETRKKLQAAFSNLPDIEITADSSDADRKLADIRRRMQELADKTIGVDLSAEEAIREAQQLKRELDELGRSSPDVRVRADTAAAAAKLGEINREVDKLDGRTATVKVKTDKSFSDATIDIALLARSLGSLAIPAAVVAGAPAIASLGSSAKTATQSLLLIPAAATAAGLAVATLKVGFSGFGDAVGDDPKKAAEAMAKMAPAAREAASAVQGLRPAWDALRLDVQQRLFAGVGEQITKVGGTYLPILQKTLGDVAEGFGYGATQVSLFLQRAETVDSVRSMFSNLENTLENLTSKTLAPLTSAFVDMGTVGSEVLLDMSDGAGRAAQSFATFIAQARQSGQLGEWMRQGVDVLRQLGQVAVNTGSILGSIFRAADASGIDFLGTLVNVTGRVREFLSSAQGQSALVTTFESIRSVTNALLPGIQAVGRAIAEIVVSREASGALTAMASAFSSLLAAAAPAVVTITGFVSRAITPLVSALGAMAPAIGPVIGALVAFRVAVSALKFASAITGMTAMRNAVVGLVGALRGAPAATAAASAAATTAGTATAAAATGAATAASRFRAMAPILAAGAVALYGIGAAANSGKVKIEDLNLAAMEGGPAFDQMRQKIIEQTDAADGIIPALNPVIDGFNEWFNGLLFGTATLDDWNKASEEQKRRLDEAARSASVSRQSFDAMRASTKEADDATGKFNDNLQLIAPALAGMKDGVSPTREMSLALEGLGRDANGAAIASGLAAQQLGGIDAGAKAAGAAMAASRESFIQAAVGAGLTEDAAAKLADQLGLIPSKVETEFRSNAAAVNLDIQQVADKVRDVPPGKTITLNAVTEDVKRGLEEIGFTVKTLPDGRVEVTAQTDAAKRELELLNSAARRPENKNINLLTLDAHSRARVLADEASKPENKQVNLEIATAQRQAQLLGDAAKRPENKHINLDTLDAHSKARVLSDEANRQANKPVNLETAQAGTALDAIDQQARNPATKPVDANVTGGLGAVDLLQGTAQQPATKTVVADVSLGTVGVQGLHAQAQAGATKPVGADVASGIGTVAMLQGSATAGATKPVGANTAAGQGAVAGLQASAQAGATKPVNANTGAATGAVSSLQSSAQAPATKTVNANTGGAMGAVNSLFSAASRTATMVVNVVKRFFGAEGGIVPARGFASGGIHPAGPARIVPLADGAVGDPMTFRGRRLNPMSSSTPRIVGANTWRVIGDRARGDELFLPLVPTSAMSQTLLEAGAARMGRQLVPPGMRLAPSSTGLSIQPMAEGGLLGSLGLSSTSAGPGGPAVAGQNPVTRILTFVATSAQQLASTILSSTGRTVAQDAVVAAEAGRLGVTVAGNTTQIIASAAAHTAGVNRQVAALQSGAGAADRQAGAAQTLTGATQGQIGASNALGGTMNAAAGTIASAARVVHQAAASAQASAAQASASASRAQAARSAPPPDDDSFESNSYYSPNRGKPGAVQAEDGSWVLPGYYKARGDIVRAGRAAAVPPGRLRAVMGDARVDESYIPHDRAPRSMALLAGTARAMGVPVLPDLAGMRAQVQAAALSRASAPRVTVNAGFDVGALVTELRGLRGDLQMSGSTAAMVDRLDTLIGVTAGMGRPSATQRAAIGRDVGAQGAW